MDLRFLGGAREIGRSAIVINDSVLLDYGLDTGNPPDVPVGTVDPDAVVVSHGHLDHVGTLPALLSGEARPPVHWTPPTRDLALLLARDTLKLHGGSYRCPFTEAEVARLTQVSRTHAYGESFETAGHEITFFRAGHIPGSAHVLVDDGETRLFYTGDFHTTDQRLVRASTARQDADVLLTESTYADTTHDLRSAVETEFAESLRRTVANGGTVVVPAFAIGRTQEVLMVCDAHDIECYVDGMGTRVIDLLRSRPEYLRDPDAFGRAIASARTVSNPGQREQVANQNTVIVTTSGMLHGGPAMTYVPAISDHPTNTIAFSGFQVPGTPGHQLLETGRVEIDGRVWPVSAGVESYELSAHADREELLGFVESYRDSRVLVNHGDRCLAFAEELRADGFDASAPELGETVSV